MMLQRVGVAGDQLLYAAREVKGEGDGHDDEQHAAEGSKATSALRETAVPLDEPVAGQGDAQQRHGGARGEEEAEQHAVEAGVVSCTQRRYRRQYWSGAGHEDGSQAEAEEEGGAARSGTGTRQASEGPFEQLLEVGHQQADAEEEQQGESDVAQEVLR